MNIIFFFYIAYDIDAVQKIISPIYKIRLKIFKNYFRIKEKES